MDTHVVYIETDHKQRYFLNSLKNLNIESTQLGFQEPFGTLFDKLPIYLDGLKNKVSNEWVILSDARDVLFYKDIDTINKTYQEHYSDYDFIVQGDDGEFGDTAFQKVKILRYEFGDGFYKYVCSGLMMGKRKAFIDFIEEVLDKVPPEWTAFGESDQPAIEWGMANLDYKTQVDTQCRIFQQTGMGLNSGVNFHLHYNKNFIKNTYTNTEPCVFHGAGKAFLTQVWKIINRNY